jgi:hypothetical protein
VRLHRSASCGRELVAHEREQLVLVDVAHGANRVRI